MISLPVEPDNRRKSCENNVYSPNVPAANETSSADSAMTENSHDSVIRDESYVIGSGSTAAVVTTVKRNPSALSMCFSDSPTTHSFVVFG